MRDEDITTSEIPEAPITTIDVFSYRDLLKLLFVNNIPVSSCNKVNVQNKINMKNYSQLVFETRKLQNFQ